MSKKEQLKRIEAKLDLILENLGFTEIKSFNASIPGGGIKPPRKDDEEEDDD